MYARMANAALVQLKNEVDKVEKALVKLIEEKKIMSKQLTPTSETESNLYKKGKTPIAIIGMASVFPQAKNLQQYWENIVGKVDCITEVPSSRWKIEDYYDPDPKAADKTYCKRGGFIPEIDFNPIEFGLPPNLLEVTDVSQLLSLVVAKQAMEDAGYSQSRKYNFERTGVILGTAVGRQLAGAYGARLHYPTWKKVLRSSGLSEEDTEKIVEKIKARYVEWEENSFPGMLANVIAGRIANRFDLGGTNCTIDAACASSLAALKMAISELQQGNADMMIAGGVDTDNSIFAYLCFSKTPALSKKQQTRPFDVDSDGMMLGEGVGMLVLKRLEDAERDGDRIYAVIKGIGTSSDGRYKSIYAPRPEGQVKALQRAYQEAGCSPSTIGLIEAHGTGTMAGDPAEFAALKEVFAKEDKLSPQIALGSVKSQIGHTKAAAGAASLVKAALALHHKLLPPTINITKPNPKLGFESSPFYLNTETRPWLKTKDEVPRRAGVSSFGFGGTNYHVVLEEYTGKQQHKQRLHKTPQPMLVFANNPQLLLARCQELLTQLKSDLKDKHYLDLLETSKSPEIPVTSARVGFVTVSVEEACTKLQMVIKLLAGGSHSAWEHPQGIYYRPTGMNLPGKIVALFSGQGSQYLEMGKELTINFPELSQAFTRMDKLLVGDGLEAVSHLVFPPPVFELQQREEQERKLQRTEYSQPMIGAFSSGLYRILQKAGFKPDFLAGHSFGELTALWAGGVLSDADYYFLVKARGQAMATPNDPSFEAGGMIAIKGDARKITEAVKQFPRIAIANFNSPNQIVLAGAKAELAKAERVLTELGYDPVTLKVSAAFHTPLVGHAEQPFAQAVDSVTLRSPKLPIYTNVTGTEYAKQPDAIAKNLKLHLRSQVRFQQEIENIYARGGRCFVEIGPRNILSNLVKDILGDRPHLVVSLNGSRQKDSDRQLREAIIQLRVAGLPLFDFDPYQTPIAAPETSTKKGLNFPLIGSNYISEKTKQAFKQALKNGGQVNLAASANHSPPSLRELQQQPVKISIASEPKAESILPSNVSKPKSTELSQTSMNERDRTQTQKTSHDRDRANPLANIPEIQVSSSRTLMTETAIETNEIVNTALKPELITTQPIPEPSMNYQQALETIELGITQFDRHQQETLQVHGQYLNQQLEYVKIFFQLMQQQNSLFANGNVNPEQANSNLVMLQSLEKNMMRFHEHQAETLKTHAQSLNYQSEYATKLFQLTQQKCSLLLEENPDLVTDEPSQALDTSISKPDHENGNGHSLVPDNSFSRGANNGTTSHIKEAIVPPELPSESTNGLSYPTQSLPEPINGFKEQETWSAKDLLDSSRDDAQIAKQPSSEIATAKQSVASVSEPIVNIPEPVPTVTTPPTEIAASANIDRADNANNVDVDGLIQILLEVVSEKTGYPSEMLELDMDMEADLGIDSIKRVEILGAMQDKFPDAPSINPEALSELRTLGQIIEQMKTLNASLNPEPRVPEKEDPALDRVVSRQESAESVNAPQHDLTPESSARFDRVQSEVVSEVTSTPSESIDVSGVSQILLEVVSEKTGYPAEMLELEMDMEADLGIDSIKRVEILGAMQDQFPKATQVNAEALAELRTLGQIIDYLKKEAAEKKSLVSNLA
jgi:polyketide-type polyunsaturated fatty acid synthase PfaA